LKTIVFLILLQLTVLAVLVHRVTLVEDQVDEIDVRMRQPPAKVLLQPVEKTISVAPDSFGLDENRLRRIIRSELNQYADSLLEAPSENPEKEVAIDPVENSRRLEVAKQEFSSFVERGEISDSEMQKFQLEISQLDSESHTMMIRKLVRALNTGELKGRF
jgi:hypothetical protein